MTSFGVPASESLRNASQPSMLPTLSQKWNSMDVSHPLILSASLGVPLYRTCGLLFHGRLPEP